MATTERRHRRDKPKKTTASRTKSPRPAGATSVHDVPDHLLELVLLRLDSSASLLRAAAACRRWRRVISTDTEFLTRFRSLHAPCVAGHYHELDPDWAEHGAPPITDNPVFVPSSASLVDSRRFSLDFLPDSDSGWAIADSRGSLLLLFKRRTGLATRWRSHDIPDLVVCDPLTRRYQGILCPEDYLWCLGMFLLDGDHIDGSGGPRLSISNFRVVAVLHDDHESEPERYKPGACVFTPGNDGGWRVLPSASTNSDAVDLPEETESITFAGRAHGSLYWVTGEDGAMLVLDEATTTFSSIASPADSIGASYDKWSFRVIGGGEDSALRLVCMINSDLKIFVRRNGGDSWEIEKLVRLPEATAGLPGREDRYFGRNAMIVAAHDTYILVTPQEKTWLFSVELETLVLEREQERNRYPGPAYPCQLPWPPALNACTNHGKRRGQSR